MGATPWRYPRVDAPRVDDVRRLDRLVHAVVGTKSAEPLQIQPMRYTKKGGGPESPDSHAKVDNTGAQFTHDAPPEWSQVNFYPPTVVNSLKHNEILDRPFIRRYFSSLERYFRRVVFVSKAPAAGYNDRFAPFPKHCLDGLSTNGCMIHLLRTRLLRHSGGLMFFHIDAFIYPRDFLGDGRMRDMLISKKHQYFGGKPDEWVFWPDHIKSDTTGIFPENGYMPWNRGIRTLGTFFWEYREANGMFKATQDQRHSNFADIFFVPSRVIDVAVEILEYHQPYFTPFEGFIGYWANLIQAMTTARHESFLHQGCCCCGADGEIPDYPAGHKMTPANKQSIDRMTDRIVASFECDVGPATVATMPVGLTDVEFENWLGPVGHIVKRPSVSKFFELSGPDGVSRESPFHLVLFEGTCRLTALIPATGGNAPRVMIVAPLTTVVDLSLAAAAAATTTTAKIYIHAPNANRVRVKGSRGSSSFAFDVVVVTGVAMETLVWLGAAPFAELNFDKWYKATSGHVGAAASSGGGANSNGGNKRVPGVVLDEGRDRLRLVSGPKSAGVECDIDTSDHLTSAVYVRGGGGHPDDLRVTAFN